MVHDVAVDSESAPDSSDEDDSNTEFKVMCLEGHEQRQGTGSCTTRYGGLRAATMKR